MAGPEFKPTFPKCEECGMYHPPNPPGKRCSLAQEKTLSGKEIDFSKFFVNLKNILFSKIKEKNIEDVNAFFGELVVSIYKFIDTYKEKK